MIPRKAIRKKCLDCCAGNTNQILFCPVVDCPLWEWRLGTRPEVLIRRDSRYKAVFEKENFKDGGPFSPEKTSAEAFTAWKSLGRQSHRE